MYKETHFTIPRYKLIVTFRFNISNEVVIVGRFPFNKKLYTKKPEKAMKEGMSDVVEKHSRHLTGKCCKKKEDDNDMLNGMPNSVCLHWDC